MNFHGDYKIDLNKLDPIDEELIVQMRSCETMVLKMMDRLETLKNYSYRERKELYLTHLRFWNHLITHQKIDLFISQSVPHETSDFVCFGLCKLKKISTLILSQTHIPDTSLIADDWELSDFGLTEENIKLRAKYLKTNVDDIKLDERFNSFFKLQTAPDQEATPFYMKDKTLLIEYWDRIASIIKKISNDPTIYFKESKLIFTAETRRLIIEINTRLLMNYYESKCTILKENGRYIFVAMHFQPELTTSPRADAYVDQLIMVQLLSACAPKGIKILVKEHPRQLALTRTKKFYDSMLSLPNVSLVSRKTSSALLIKKSLAVATCTGLAGFEALFKLKPVLMFGHDFYAYFPGVFNIRTKNDLDIAMSKIAQSKLFNYKDIKISLKALENVSIHGTVDIDYLPTSSLSIEENSANIAEAIYSKIKQRKVK